MYNKQPCASGDSYQLACDCVRPLECADREMEDFHDKQDVGVEFKGNHVPLVVGVMESMKRTAYEAASFPSSGSTASVLEISLNTSRATETTSGTQMSDTGKRPYSYVDVEAVNKRARQFDQAQKLDQFFGVSRVSNNCDEKTYSEEPEGGRVVDCLDDNDKGLAVGILTCNSNDMNMSLVQPVDVRQTIGLDLIEDLYSPFLEQSQRRHVSIGPDHQADIPDCMLCDSKKLIYKAQSYGTSPADFEIDESSKWLGTCVMPMEARSCSLKINCDCKDKGSIRCVRQHVSEARENLNRELGQEKFMQLGFCEMGEVVAQRWTEEEKNLFNEAVFSNPSSLGRNFWTVLSLVFPDREFKELVSYYFNVFMLRKRADQNRFDPLNVDSDNDEWQESSDEEFAASEEDEEEEDSAVESPVGEYFPIRDNSAEEVDVLEDVDDEEEHEDHLIGTEEDEEFCCGFSGCRRYELLVPTVEGADDVHDAQDDSCTSYEDHQNGSSLCHGHADDVHGPAHLVEGELEDCHATCRNDVFIGTTEDDYMNGHLGSKPWEFNLIGSTDKGIEFLPTCNVIEEVLGKGFGKRNAE